MTDNKNKALKRNNTDKLTGEGSVKIWATHMGNYLSDFSEAERLSLAESYLTDISHEWWIVYSEIENGKAIRASPLMG